MRIHLAFFFIFISLFSFSWCLLVDVHVQTGYCLSHQRSLLLHMRKNLLFDLRKSSKLRQWNQTSDCCEWSGVTCDGGLVAALNLSQESIYGGIDDSSSLFGLQYLQSLDLSYNYLNNTMPSAFHKLQILRYLNLKNAGFVGQIPIEISQLTRLVSLDMSTDRVGELKLRNPNLQTLIQNLSDITNVCLDGVSISASGSEWCNALSSSLPNLQELSLGSCNLSGPLDSSLAKLKSISTVKLNSNNLSSSIPAFFARFKNLTVLDLSNCSLHGNFPDGIFQIESLEYLNVSSNDLLHGSLTYFPQNGSLQTLALEGTSFSGSLPNCIGNLRHLLWLDLSGCNFTGTLPNSLSTLTQLIHLNLSYNHFFGPIPSFNMSKNLTSLWLIEGQIDDSINISTSLKVIGLTNNHLEGPIPTSIFMLPSIEYILLANNQFKDRLDNIINISSSLKYIDLRNNSLEGVIPSSIFMLPSLTTIRFGHNQFEGQVFDMINVSSSLQHLDLSDNNLYGTIPQEIDNYFPMLRSLFLSNNKFIGTITKSLCNLVALEILDLSKNLFIGRIPECLITMNGTINVLNLSKNKLSGSIDILPSSCHLEILHLNDNFLEGMLPKHLTTCTNLQVLDLGNNRFNDKFPCWLNSLSTLQVLILGSNQLHGSISCARTNSSLSSLHIFDLASNNFSGNVPPLIFKSKTAMMFDTNDKNHPQLEDLNFQNLYIDKVDVTCKGLEMELVKTITTFTSIDLSGNRFEGSISEEIGQLKALNMLNFSHNNFSSHIPSSLGNLKNLESLDLSHNSLSGEIPPQLASMNFLEVLNLSFNHLVGTIPTGTQLQSFPPTSFASNDLCGPPLTQNCSKRGTQLNSYSNARSSIDWNFISFELGFTFGIGIIFLPLLLWKPWRLWYWKHAENMLYHIFPQLDFVYEIRGGQRYRTLRWRRH